MRRIPKEWRTRDYYVFFTCGGAYPNQYAVVRAVNMTEAHAKACAVYGNMNIGRLEVDGVYAEEVIRNYNKVLVENESRQAAEGC